MIESHLFFIQFKKDQLPDALCVKLFLGLDVSKQNITQSGREKVENC